MASTEVRYATPITKSRSTVLRIAAVCALVGTLTHLAAGALHGALTAGTDQSNAITVYEHVLDTPAWAAVNLVMLLAVLIWLAVFIALEYAGHESTTWQGWLGRLASTVLSVGIAAAALLFLTDAIVLPTLAEQWADADPERQSELVVLGDTVQTAIRTPLFHTLPLFVYGLPFALLGAAHTSRGSLLPTWLAWLTLLAGTAAFAFGMSRALGSTAVPELVLWAGIQPLIWIWGITTGISLWRHANRRHESPATRQ